MKKMELIKLKEIEITSAMILALFIYIRGEIHGSRMS